MTDNDGKQKKIREKERNTHCDARQIAIPCMQKIEDVSKISQVDISEGHHIHTACLALFSFNLLAVLVYSLAAAAAATASVVARRAEAYALCLLEATRISVPEELRTSSKHLCKVLQRSVVQEK